MKRIGLTTLTVILSAFVITADAYGASKRSPEPSRDVAVTKISTPSNCIQGDTVPVVVTVENQGRYDEKFVVTLTYTTDVLEIGSEFISLPCQSSLMDGIADKTFTGEKTGDKYYTTVSGDIDGDNYADLLVGAYTYNTNQGRTYLYYGGPDMDTICDLTFDGEPATNFGFISGIGDVDNDNYDDIITGAYNYNNRQGRAYLFYGDARARMDTICDLTFDGETEGSHFGVGWDDIICEDIDGDNYADIVIPAPKYNSGQGRVYLYWGNSKANMNADADLIFTPPDSGGNYGIGMACGDIDNDGYKDIVIGASYYPDNSHYGRAYLYWGDKESNMDTTCDLVFDAESADTHDFGCNVGIADIDNDNYDDVVIGAYRYGSNRGRAYLYWGSTKSKMDTFCDLTFSGEQDKSDFAELCISGGDVNADGFADILVGAKQYRGFRGRAYLFYGDAKAYMDTNPDFILTGENEWDWFGDPPGGSFGDFNNDGYDDIVVGAVGWKARTWQGRVYLYYGEPNKCSTDMTFYWDTNKASTGEHTLKAEIVPVAGEEDTADNTMTATVNVKTKVKEK